MVEALLKKISDKTAKICIVGVGYVGKSLADALSEHFQVVGYDIDESKVEKLNGDKNKTIVYTSDPSKICESDISIICVPTLVKKSKDPDLSYVVSASETVGKSLRKGGLIILEPTFYPGVTEETVIPILEMESGLKCGRDFKVGYSPERINPGDDVHAISKVTKIVSGIDEETLEIMAALYGMIAPIYKAPNIKTAEAAKVIENIQRDINIALVNELALITHRLGLDIHEVLEAAGTKWNFHRYEPGLVGGYCIPVNPYYMVYKAKEVGYHPQIITAGRSINDSMPHYVAEMTVKSLIDVGKLVKDAKVLIMGLTYKENVGDYKESPSKYMSDELKLYGIDVYGYDPLLSNKETRLLEIKPYNIQHDYKFDAIIVAVKHKEILEIQLDDILNHLSGKPILIDIKGIYNKQEAKKKGVYYKKL